MDLVKISLPIPLPLFHSSQGRAVQEQWYSVTLIKTVSFIALCRFTVVGSKRSFHNPPPRIYRAKNNRNEKTEENGRWPTRINCVRHICVLSRGFTDKMARWWVCSHGKAPWSFATVSQWSINSYDPLRFENTFSP